MEIERLLRIREGILAFFKLQEEEATAEIFGAWLQSLPPYQRRQHLEMGQRSLVFQTYRLEQKGFYIDQFLKGYLSPDDYDYFLQIGSTLPVKKEAVAVC